jgi:hypothetical protein
MPIAAAVPPELRLHDSRFSSAQQIRTNQHGHTQLLVHCGAAGAAAVVGADAGAGAGWCVVRGCSLLSRMDAVEAALDRKEKDNKEKAEPQPQHEHEPQAVQAVRAGQAVQAGGAKQLEGG